MRAYALVIGENEDCGILGQVEQRGSRTVVQSRWVQYKYGDSGILGIEERNDADSGNREAGKKWGKREAVHQQIVSGTCDG